MLWTKKTFPSKLCSHRPPKALLIANVFISLFVSFPSFVPLSTHPPRRCFASVLEGKAWHDRPKAIGRALTGTNWMFIVLKWSECSPNPGGVNLLYLFNETLSVTGLQAGGCRGRSFPRDRLDICVSEKTLGGALTQATRYQQRGLWTNTPHCICIHFHLAKKRCLSTYCIHSPQLLEGFLWNRQYTFYQVVAQRSRFGNVNTPRKSYFHLWQRRSIRVIELQVLHESLAQP